jgi:hypothetical protein
MNEYIKFGNNTNITPSLISSDDLMYIFRLLAKEREDNADEYETSAPVIDYELFKKGLILIAIEGSEILKGEKKKDHRDLNRKPIKFSNLEKSPPRSIKRGDISQAGARSTKKTLANK